jgi:peptidoglycan/LPS O-acetylase OafA/YrhL
VHGEETAAGNPARYLPALDGLRAIAVLGVLLSHYAAAVPWVFYGALGVQLFFVLSGFLITGILLRARADAAEAGASRLSVVGHFYVRRALRLLPLFYAVLAIAWLVDFETTRSTVLWHALYASNLRFILVGSWESSFAHFWSLAVEEQFYFMWPFVILWAPQRWLPLIVFGAAVSAPLFRLLSPALGVSDMAQWTLPLGSFDALALGALLAIGRSQVPKVEGSERVRRLIRVLFLFPTVFVLAIGAAQVFAGGLPWALMTSIGRFACVIVFMWFVDQAATYETGTIGRALRWEPLVYIGRISYGVYVLHAFTPFLLEAVGLRAPDHPWLRFVVLSLTTIGLASVSWFVLEAPINRFRRRFPYVGHAALKDRAAAWQA